MTSNTKPESLVDEIRNALISVSTQFTERPDLFKIFGSYQGKKDLLFKVLYLQIPKEFLNFNIIFIGLGLCNRLGIHNWTIRNAKRLLQITFSCRRLSVLNYLQCKVCTKTIGYRFKVWYANFIKVIELCTLVYIGIENPPASRIMHT